MKRKLLSLVLVIVSTILATACGESSTTTTTPNNSETTSSKPETAKVDDSKWTDKDKENAINNCKFGRKNDDAAKVEKLCQCYLDKVIALSPDPTKQSEIPMDKVIKLNADCAKEAGL